LYHVRQSDCARVRHPVARCRFDGGEDDRSACAADAAMLPSRGYRRAVAGAALGPFRRREPMGRR